MPEDDIIVIEAGSAVLTWPCNVKQSASLYDTFVSQKPAAGWAYIMFSIGGFSTVYILKVESL